jgi:hypothetical protein
LIPFFICAKCECQVLRQFPDCRFVYAFFRARTLGYDVYPEDYFLPNFPWQQYGGLWICDEARFARSEPLNPLNAQALRRITGEGAMPRAASSNNSPTSPFTSGGFHHLPATNAHVGEEIHTQLPSYVPSLDGCSNSHLTTTQVGSPIPLYNTNGLPVALPQPQTTRPHLSLLTDVGRKYPGFPTPLSPTTGAKELWPSPVSELGRGTNTPRPLSPAVRSVSPMSIDGSEMCGPSRRCNSHGYEHYAASMGLIDSVIAQNKAGGILTPPRSPSVASQSPTSPASPRTAMRRVMQLKQAFQSMSHNPTLYPVSSAPSSTSPPPLSIQISNGTETCTTSPLSSTGTLLSYTSHRPVDSGLLGVRPLSEAQVAEYRFWRPCGKRVCAFGCGGANEGEVGAAKRLFRGVEDVCDEQGFGLDGCRDEKEGTANGVFRFTVEEQEEAARHEAFRASVWAGRRLVSDWGRFLGGLEREGVARL